MSRLGNQRNDALARIGKCKQLIEQVVTDQATNGRPLTPLYTNWMAEALAKAEANLKAVDVENVLALRNAKKNTYDSLEGFLNVTVEQITKPLSGVFSCIDSIFGQESSKLRGENTRKLHQIQKLCERVVKLCYWMRHPVASVILSPAAAAIIVFIGVCLAAIFTATHFAHHPVKGLTPSQSVQSHVNTGLEHVQKAATQPGQPILKRIEKAVEAFIDFLPTVTKDIGVVAALVLAVQRLASVLAGKADKKAA